MTDGRCPGERTPATTFRGLLGGAGLAVGVRMGHPLRMYEPGVMYEVTIRAIQGRMLLQASEEANDLILGVFGRALAVYPAITLFALVVIDNHMTYLVSSSRPELLPRFFSHVHGNVSREIGDLYDWPNSFWERRCRPIPVVDEPMMINRLHYCLSQGCKEGLVISPRTWHGVTCVPSLIDGTPLEGTWYDRDSISKAKRRGRDADPKDYATTYTVPFGKIPCWAHVSDEEYAARVTAIVDQIEEETRATHPDAGVTAGRWQDPHRRPETIAKSPAPLCHASSPETRRSYRDRYRAFTVGFRDAAERLKRGLAAIFPLYAIPPPPPMVLATS